MPQLTPGQTFPSLAEFKKALQEWAVEQGFTPAILDSDTHRVRAGCRSSTDCTFRIRANFSTKTNQAKVTTIHNEHTCSSGSGEQEVKRAAACRVKFLSEAVPKLLTVTEETSTKAIIEAIEKRYGQKIATRQAQKVKRLLCPKEKGPCKICGNKWHRVKRCPRLPQSPNQQDDDNQPMELDDNEETFGLDLMQDADPNPSSPDRESPLPHSRISNAPLPVPGNGNHLQPALSTPIQPITPPTLPATSKLMKANLTTHRNSQHNSNNVRNNSIARPNLNHNTATQNNNINQHNSMNQPNGVNPNSNVINQHNPSVPNLPHNISQHWESEGWDPQLTQRTPFHHHHQQQHQQLQHPSPTTQVQAENPLTQLTTTVANNAVSAAAAIPQVASFSIQPVTPVRQDKSIEIARLLEQAGRMMQEAAKLTFEAARLTAATAS